ncbi:hypothetical protein H8959_003415 [Pygathrix nigripes]
MPRSGKLVSFSTLTLRGRINQDGGYLKTSSTLARSSVHVVGAQKVCAERRIWILKSKLRAQGQGVEAPEGAHEPAHPRVPRAQAGPQDWVRPFGPKQLCAQQNRGRGGEGSPKSSVRPAPSPEPRRAELHGAERLLDILFSGPAAPPAPLLILSFLGC